MAGLHSIELMTWTEEYQVEVLKMCHRVFDRFGRWSVSRSGISPTRYSAGESFARRQQEGCVHAGPPAEGKRAPPARGWRAGP